MRDTRPQRTFMNDDVSVAPVATIPSPADLALVLRRLPEWIPEGASDQGYRLVETRGAGDCLFESVSVALKTAMRGRPYTPYELRRAVARTISDPSDRRASAALDEWKLLLLGAIEDDDDEMIGQLSHAFPLIFDEVQDEHRDEDVTVNERDRDGRRNGEMMAAGEERASGQKGRHRKKKRQAGDAGNEEGRGAQARREVSELMLDPSVYWGDQYAVDVLERLLDVRIAVIVPSKWNKPRRQAARYGGGCDIAVGPEAVQERARAMPSERYRCDGDVGDRWRIVLVLEGMHYSPVVRTRYDRRGGGEAPAYSIESTAFGPHDTPEWASA